AERDPDDHRDPHPALAAEVEPGHLGHDLVVGRVDEAVELDLDHRPVAAHREADGGADDAGLRQRGVDDPGVAEVLLQAVGDPEDAAQRADVLAHDDDLVVVLHRLAQTGVEGLGQGHRRHDDTSSNDAAWASYAACWAASSAVFSAWTKSH